MRDKVFVLCVGCQKGATSWLHDQLSTSEYVDFGFAKEYHVFDSLHIPKFEHFHNSKIARLEAIFEKKIELKKRHSDLISNINFVLNVENYYNYFDYLWHRDEKITTVGDFTPSYSPLPESAFKEIKKQLELRGFRVKVVFTMRDPVERCWSMVRMRRRNILKRDPNANLIPEAKDLKNSYKNRPCELFSRYEHTVETLESVFDPSDIFYGIYENLFDDQSLQQLEKFFELPDFKPNVKTKVNESKKSSSSELPKDLVHEIMQYYKPTYEYCDNRFNTSEYWKTLSVA